MLQMCKLSFFGWISFTIAITYVWAIEIKCGLPGKPLYGTVNIDENMVQLSVQLNDSRVLFSVGYEVTYKCKEGEIIGDRKRTCQTSGTWSGTVPICELAEGIEKRTKREDRLSFINSENGLIKPLPICGSPETPAYGQFKYIEGGNGLLHAIFHCFEGYYLSGDAVITCNTGAIYAKDKRWSGRQPICMKLEDQQKSIEQPNEKSAYPENQAPDRTRNSDAVDRLPNNELILSNITNMNERVNKLIPRLNQLEEDKARDIAAINIIKDEMNDEKRNLQEIQMKLDQLEEDKARDMAAINIIKDEMNDVKKTVQEFVMRLDQLEEDKTRDKAAININKDEMNDVKKTMQELVMRMEQLANLTNSTSAKLPTSPHAEPLTLILIVTVVVLLIAILALIITIKQLCLSKKLNRRFGD